MPKCDRCPMTDGPCHGESCAPTLCDLAATGNPAALGLVRDRRQSPCPGNDPAPKLPPLASQAVHFVRAVVSHVAAGRPEVNDEQYAERLRQCESCPQLVLPDWRCGGVTGCGCWLKAKAKWAGEDCPLGRWPRHRTPDSGGGG